MLSFCFVNHTVLFQVTGCSSTDLCERETPFKPPSLIFPPLPFPPLAPSLFLRPRHFRETVFDPVSRIELPEREREREEKRKEKEFTAARFSPRLSSAHVRQGDRNWASMLAVSAQTRITFPPPSGRKGA